MEEENFYSAAPSPLINPGISTMTKTGDLIQTRIYITDYTEYIYRLSIHLDNQAEIFVIR